MKTKKIILLFLIPIIFGIIISSCGTTGRGVMYSERSINVNDVSIQTVAILPNRLPMNLQDAEYWRKYNWEVTRNRFQREGFRVIDYNTSNDMFKKSGLPLDDTKSSRDKYAELAEEMNADILIFPYYGNSYSVTGLFDQNNYNIVATFQIYLASQNDFMTRIDFDGKNYYYAFTKIAPLVTGVASMILGIAGAYELASIPSLISIPLIFPSFVPANTRWKKAFKKAINKGLNQFFMKYKVTRAAKPATKVMGKYDKYSLQELENMKKTAVENADYTKAAEIKKEIDKRK